MARDEPASWKSILTKEGLFVSLLLKV